MQASQQYFLRRFLLDIVTCTGSTTRVGLRSTGSIAHSSLMGKVVRRTIPKTDPPTGIFIVCAAFYGRPRQITACTSGFVRPSTGKIVIRTVSSRDRHSTRVAAVRACFPTATIIATAASQQEVICHKNPLNAMTLNEYYPVSPTSLDE
uniref:Uncharacterized protein n=1 Tax=Romanomermis culicivorax TaxID=13658 RepID=A0A915KK68_ROMCU